jgi:uncharacterized repeat protein (TIGR02543 family)
MKSLCPTAILWIVLSLLASCSSPTSSPTSTPVTYTITFNANGGTGTMANQSLASGATATLTANTFTRTGYSFAGWATTSTGGAGYSDQASYTMGSSNVALYAIWSNQSSGTTTITTLANYTVTISGPTSLTVGTTYTFASVYTGNSVSYQWYLNGSERVSATSSTLSLRAITSMATNGNNLLTLAVTDSNGLVYSGSLPITVQ